MLSAALLPGCGEATAWAEHKACCATLAAWCLGLGKLLRRACAGYFARTGLHMPMGICAIH